MEEMFVINKNQRFIVRTELTDNPLNLRDDLLIRDCSSGLVVIDNLWFLVNPL